MKTNKLCSVANEFLKISKNEKTHEEMTALKLLKLVYLAYCHHQDLHKRPLFENDIECWEFGPAVPDLYSEIREFGNDIIPCNYFSESGEAYTLSDKTTGFLYGIYTVYGKFSDIQLSNLTNTTGSLFSVLYESMEARKILDDDITNYYENIRFVTNRMIELDPTELVDLDEVTLLPKS